MYPKIPRWKLAIVQFIQGVLQDSIDHLRLLTDHSQLNRRVRGALKAGRATRASYLAVSHHQRRLARRREIRRLVEGPVSANR
jgi:hypothetical protein